MELIPSNKIITIKDLSPKELNLNKGIKEKLYNALG
jgi:hypothetical protein